MEKNSEDLSFWLSVKGVGLGLIPNNNAYFSTSPLPPTINIFFPDTNKFFLGEVKQYAHTRPTV